MKQLFILLFIFAFFNFLQPSEGLENKLEDIILKKLNQFRTKFEQMIMMTKNNPALEEVCGFH